MEAKQQIVQVLWNDSFQQADVWVNFAELDEIQDTCFCESVGYLIKETDKSIFLAMSRNTAQYGKVFCIPRNAIVSIKEL